MNDFTIKDKYDIYDLKALVSVLRSENGCPWDKVQTHASLRRDFLEECYEVCEAIDDNDSVHLREELGDVLMHIIFHAGIEEDAGAYNIDDVADEECKKLISRHPHVFGDAVARSAEEVLESWDDIKMRERSQTKVSDVMDGIAKSLPATWRADKVISKAEKGGFLSKSLDESMSSIENGLDSLKTASDDDKSAIIGDILFSAVRAARNAGYDPEELLNLASDRFIDKIRSCEAGTKEVN